MRACSDLFYFNDSCFAVHGVSLLFYTPTDLTDLTDLIWSLRSKLSENLVENLSKAYGMDDCLKYDGKILTSELAGIFLSGSNFYSLCKMNKGF